MLLLLGNEAKKVFRIQMKWIHGNLALGIVLVPVVAIIFLITQCTASGATVSGTDVSESASAATAVASAFLGFVFIVGLLVVGVLVYFLPCVIATIAHRRNIAAIFVLNLLLGWTFVGWVAALVWACVRDSEIDIEIIRRRNRDALPSPRITLPSGGSRTAEKPIKPSWKDSMTLRVAKGGYDLGDLTIAEVVGKLERGELIPEDNFLDDGQWRPLSECHTLKFK